MKKTSKRVLSIVLCVMMLLGSLTVAFAADNAEPAYKYGAKYYLATTDATNADITLDKLDEILAGVDIYKEVDLNILGSIVIDLRSISGLCKTIDDLKPIINAAKLDVTGAILGDLNSIVIKNWKTGMKRGKTADVTIVNEIIKFLSDNKSLIGKIVDGSIDLGLVGNYVDLNALLGPDGVYGLIKGLIVEKVLKKAKGSEAYNAVYAKKLDDILYTDVFARFNGEDGALPGFTMNNDSTVDNLLLNVFSSCWDKYIVPNINKLNANWTESENEALRKLDSILNLTAAEVNISSVTFDKNGSFSGQVNNVLGKILKCFYPGIKWTNGDKSKLSANLDNLYKQLAQDLGLASSDALTIVKYIVKNLEIEGLGDYTGNVDSWKSMKDAAAVVLRNSAKVLGIPVTSASSATYENILGDYLTYAMRKYVDFGYSAGSGKNVWTVINDIANVYLYDKGFAKAYGLKAVASDSIFTKLDEIIAMTKIFGSTTPADYKSEKFLKTDLLEAIFSLDIAKIVDITAVRFLGDFGSKKAVEVIYTAGYNFLLKWFGKEIIGKYTATNPLDTLISNKKLTVTVQNFLAALESKKATILPPVLYLTAIIIGSYPTSVTVNSASTAVYTGDKTYPTSVTVTVDGVKKTLSLDKDYDAASSTSASESFNVGDSCTAVLNIYGYTKGDINVSYKVALGAPKSLKVSDVKTTSAKLSWAAVTGAESYKITANGKTYTTSTTSCTVSGLTAGKEITATVTAVCDKGTSASSSVKVLTAPDKITSLKATPSATSIKLTWAKPANASGYKVEYSTDNKTWTAKTTTSTSYTISSLKANTKYYVKVTAYAKASSTVYGAAVSTTSTTLLASPSVKVTATDSTIKLTWAKVAGATNYVVKYGSTTKTLSSSTLSYTLSKQSANKAFTFTVQAKSKTNNSAVVTVKASTAPTKVTGLKVSSPTSTTLKVSWKKVTGATGYQVSYSTSTKSGWKTVTVTGTSTTLTKLTSNKKYYVKVAAIKKYGNATSVGTACANVTGTTAVAAVKGLKASKTTKNSVTLNWTKVSGASGYEIYRLSGSTWKKVGTVTKGTTATFTNSGLSRNTTYKYKVKAYKTVSKTKVYGDFSSQISAKTKFF